MLFDNEYKTIKNPSSGEFRDRGSRFIAFAFPVSDEHSLKINLNKTKKEHPKANHHCYAFRLGPAKAIFRFSDDREPSGTAGKQIYGVIQSNDLTDILIIVARYFGGTLLGVTGLIHAYRVAASIAVQNADIILKPVTEKYQLEFGFEQMHDVMILLRKSHATILSQHMTDTCRLIVEVSKKDSIGFYQHITHHHTLVNNCQIYVL